MKENNELHRIWRGDILEIQDESQWAATLNKYPLIRAAGGVVRNPCGELLMIFKRGKWDLPKGTFESGETLEQCALREVQEECGVTGLAITALLGSACHIYQETDGIEYLKHTLWYAMTCDNCRTPHPQEQEGITQAVWAAPAQVQENLKNAYGTIGDLAAGRNI